MRPRHVAPLLFAFACSSSSAPNDEAAAPPGTSVDASGGGDDAGPTAGDASAPGSDAPPSDAAPSDANRACPAGLGARWTCAANARQRCVDAKLEERACAYGCADGAGGDDAECGCGPNAAFSRLNCAADGQLYECASSIYVARSCASGCDVAPNGTDDTCKPAGGPLADLVAKLGPQCGQYSPGTTCGVAVRDLATGEVAAWHGDDSYVSASSAKVLWVAGALYDVGIAPVAPHAEPIFANSDNVESGAVIDLLASPARVNTFMWNDAALAESGFCHWNYGKTRDAANCSARMGGDNFFSANDMVFFLSQIWDRSLLGETASAQLLSWMTLSPRSGYGGWLGTQLPAAAQKTMHHKAGWLPPSEVPGYSNSNDVGVVEVPGGHAYAVALLLNGGTDYDGKQLPTLEYASCVVYHGVARDVPDALAACTHP
jgi:beta-lactamase class A